MRDMVQRKGESELYAEAGGRALEPYRSRQGRRDLDEGGGERSRQLMEAERQLRSAGLRASRDELYRLRRARRIDDETLRRMVRDIDLAEARYGS